jgi:TPR repeat protein
MTNAQIESEVQFQKTAEEARADDLFQKSDYSRLSEVLRAAEAGSPKAMHKVAFEYWLKSVSYVEPVVLGPITVFLDSSRKFTFTWQNHRPGVFEWPSSKPITWADIRDVFIYISKSYGLRLPGNSTAQRKAYEKVIRSSVMFDGIKRARALSKKWYEKAYVALLDRCSRGDQDSIFDLILAYEYGHGTPKDIGKAVYWTRKYRSAQRSDDKVNYDLERAGRDLGLPSR